MKKETQIIEFTSKKLKLNKLFAGIVLILGIIILIISGLEDAKAGIFIGLFLTIVGLIWYIFIKIKIWWYHK